ncbi:hypothetical protein BDZ85DRAFT_268050 [Elsinoe ampelina]|uniref:Extracellular membrane protein CFEM domain-containing protein n=1 Tax=Elsinoe ampelina TaxID=302913 RepID=A0A6A6G1T7_9PEZI|nr:hypothetical protein BDZ85DRAFT_268050 [Elsinoe ampelina]
MRFEYSILTILAATAAVHAQLREDDGDIPQQCRDVCTPVVALAGRCDREDDARENFEFIDCVCRGAEVNSIPACEACVNFYDNDDNDNDVNDLRTSCNLPTATFAPNSQGGATPTGNANTQPTTGTTGTTAVGGAVTSGTSRLSSATSAAGSSASSIISSVTSRAGSAGAGASSTASSVVASFTGGAAAMAPPVGAAAAAILGLANFL